MVIRHQTQWSAEKHKREQAERVSDEAAAKVSQAEDKKRKVEEHYKADIEKGKADAAAAAAQDRKTHEAELASLMQGH